jgi:hypothetical protein
MDYDPRYGIPLMSEGQSQKYLTHNQAIHVLAFWTSPVVQARTNTPATSPNSGEAWIVGDSPTGIWSTHAKAIALYIGTEWFYLGAPEHGRVYNLDDSAMWIIEGGIWGVQSGSGGVTKFEDLSDVDIDWTTDPYKPIMTNSSGDGVEVGYIYDDEDFIFQNLNDVTANYNGHAGYLLAVNQNEDGMEIRPMPALGELSDVAVSDYSGMGGWIVMVKDDLSGVTLRKRHDWETVRLHISLPGKFAPSQTVYCHAFEHAATFHYSFGGSVAKERVHCTASGVEFVVKQNGTQIGTITFRPGSSTPDFYTTGNVRFEVGDLLTIVSPTADATLEDIGISLLAWINVEPTDDTPLSW